MRCRACSAPLAGVVGSQRAEYDARLALRACVPGALSEELVAIWPRGHDRDHAPERVHRRGVELVVTAQPITHNRAVRLVIRLHGFQLLERPLRRGPYRLKQRARGSDRVPVRAGGHGREETVQHLDGRGMSPGVEAQQLARRDRRLRRDLLEQSRVVGLIVIVYSRICHLRHSSC